MAGAPGSMRGHRQAERLAARGHALHQQPEVEHARQHQPGVERGEGGLEAGHAHRRQLERLLLLLARVRGVVGGHAVDRAGAQRLDQRLAVGLGAQRRVHLEVRVERADRLVGEQQVVRRGLAGHLRARPPGRARSPRPSRARTRAARGCGRPRRRRARSRARPAWTRTPTGCRPARAAPTPRPRASRPGPTATGSSSWSASSRPARRWYWSAWRITPAERTGRPSSVKPAAPASASSAISVSCSPLLADGDRGQEAGRDARLGAGALAQRAQHRRRVHHRVACWAGRGSRRSRRPPRRACRSRCPPRPRGRACAGARAGRRRRGRRAGPRRRPPRRPRAPRGASPISAITPSRTSRSARPSSAGARVEQPRAADQHAWRPARRARSSSSARLMPAAAPSSARRAARRTARRARPAARRAPPSAPPRPTRPARRSAPAASRSPRPPARRRG